ncbi:SusC/RagA family TonB-linked outer membrane protein [Cyclobacterium roseum]|uniref:SusC/RagA family TonB-linked outer membrane protein n=1 Tax=Cyclobacterium roseum TaxID=2666137 RepID=UPI0013914344|nr:SusC/RagA family TonB-linked outer membrane protein [Cyclobacterium roseum]
MKNVTLHPLFHRTFLCIGAMLLLGLLASEAFAQTRVSGTVRNESREPLPGVSILVVGTSIGTVTDIEGQYALSVPEGSQRLSFSFIGFESQTMDLNGRSNLDVVMQEDSQDLGEVVVTAFGVQRERKELGYTVQALKPEDLTTANDFNLVNSLSGKIAGVQVTNSGSQVGASSRIVIRGNASFSGNQPLFVVDGIPIDNSSSNLGGAGGLDYGNTAADIDPENIASLTVLKGANAAALYGNRATHGVILIETKKGKQGKAGLGVEFNTSMVFDVPSFFMDFQNEYGPGQRGGEYDWQQYLENNPGSNLSYNEYAKQNSYNYVDGIGGGVNENATSWGPRYDAGLLLDQWVKGPDSPWESIPNNIQDHYFQTGKNFINQVAVTARGEDAYGRVAFSNRQMNGTFFNTDQTVNTFNASLTLLPTDKLKVSTDFNYVNRYSDNIPVVSYGSMTKLAWGAFRNIPLNEVKKVYEEHGNEMGSGYNRNANNFYYDLENTNSMDRKRFFGNVNLDYQLNDWLSANMVTGLDYYNEERESITLSRTRANINNDRGGQFSLTNLSRQEFNSDIRLNINKQFMNDFSLVALVGGNFRQNRSDFLSLSAPDLAVPDLFNISNVRGTPGTGMSESQRETYSVYSSATLGYKGYLFLGATGRNDWSSTLPEENRSYFYPSVNMALTLSEALDLNSTTLSHAQVRASLAQVGSDTDPYQLMGTYGTTTFNNISLFTPTAVKPPTNLLPEMTTSFEVGADLRFFSDRLSLDATYYRQVTENMILQVPTARSTGYASQLINAAEIENKGIELILRGSLMRRGDFSWDATINWAKNTSTVVSLYEGLENITISSGFGGVRLVGTPEQPWGDLSGLPYVRDDAGNIMINPNGTPMTTNQQVILGNVTPDWIGGIQNTFRYRNFTFGGLLDFRMGGDFFSTTYWHSYPTGAFENSVQNDVRAEGIVVEGVQGDGSPNDIRISAQDYYNGSWVWNNHEYSIIDGSFVKLRELTFGYRFNIWKLQNVTFSVFGRNLAILHRSAKAKELGLDPESASQMGGGEAGTGFENFMPPTNRSYGFNLRIAL